MLGKAMTRRAYRQDVPILSRGWQKGELREQFLVARSSQAGDAMREMFVLHSAQAADDSGSVIVNNLRNAWHSGMGVFAPDSEDYGEQRISSGRALASCRYGLQS